MLVIAVAALLSLYVCVVGSITALPENITVTFLNPSTVKISWQTFTDQFTIPIEKYDVIYKQTDARVVTVVAGNSEAVTLTGLTPDTQYQLTVTAVWSGKKYRSRPIVFRTLEPPKKLSQQDQEAMSFNKTPILSHSDTGHIITLTDEYGHLVNKSLPNELPTVRGVEIGIVLLVLVVWIGAIALFFNRWGKIRMLIPYQPDFKQEQLKVPGTGVCTSKGCNGVHSHQCLPRCEGCGLLDRCFHCPRRTTDQECGCQFALLHRSDTAS